MRVLMLTVLAFSFSGAAHAAKMTKSPYPTAIQAAKAEAARRFDAAKKVTGFPQTGRTGLSAHRTGKLSLTVSYPLAWAGTAVTNVKVVKKADGYHAYSAKKVTITDL